MKKRTKITLLFPPMSDLMGPYLSIPSLTAFLRQNGYRVIQKDLNIETFDALLTKSKLQLFYEKAYKIFKDLENNSEQHLRYAMLAEILFFAPKAIANIEKAKRILRDKENFYDPKRYSWSSEIVYNALKLILRQNYPYNRQFRIRSIKQLMEFIYDEEKNPFLEFFKEKIVPSILKDAPDLVGISITYSTQIGPGFTLARLIKEKAKGIHICIGGSIIPYLADRLAKNKELFSIVDTFIINEGEHALLKLVERIENNKDFKGVPNLISSGDNGFLNNENNFIEDINSLPTPDFDGFPINLYLSPEPVIPLLTSRGCYWGKCVFCYVSKLMGKYYRARNKDLLIEDIRSLSRRYNTTHFFFSDNAISPKRLKDISSLIIKNKINICWQTEARFEKAFTKDSCSLISRAGCRNLSFGFESGSSRVLKLMQKGTHLKTIKKVLKNFRNANIYTNLQLFIGFPTETREEANKTLHFILKNNDIINSVSLCGPFRLFKDTEVFASPEYYGITKIYKKDISDIKIHYTYEVKSGMNMEESNRVSGIFGEKINKLYRSFIMFPTPNLNAHRLLYSNYEFNGKGK